MELPRNLIWDDDYIGAIDSEGNTDLIAEIFHSSYKEIVREIVRRYNEYETMKHRVEELKRLVREIELRFPANKS